MEYQRIAQTASQKQKLSFQTIQTMNLFSKNMEQLREEILKTVDENPALEIVDFADRENIKVERKSTNWENTSSSDRAASKVKSDNHQAFLENQEDRQETLQEHLLRQLNILQLSDEENEIGSLIISNLNEKGYHIEAMESLFWDYKCKSTGKIPNLEKVYSVLEKIQKFDPVGVCCKNLAESLYLQAKEAELSDFTQEFLKKYFMLIEPPKPAAIQKKLLANGITAETSQIEKMLEEIRSLEPFPARNFCSSQTVFIMPDVRIKNFEIELVKTNLPEIRIDPKIENSISNDKELQNNITNAKNFLTSIEMRNQTLLKVTQELLIRQRAFFEKGPGNIRPLRMKDVAEKIGVHETTVSRIANNKYLECEWGLFEFKYFFSNAVGTGKTKESKTEGTSISSNESLSKEAVKAMLSKIISENEKSGGKAMSDQKLSDVLASQGIKIARRTVAKYRRELNVNSSYDR